MKLRKFVSVLLCLILTLSFVGCGGGGNPTTYTVKFMNGTVEFDSKTVTEGATVSAPATNPTQAADSENTYTFAGWYNGETAWNFANPVNSNLTLTAQFTSTPIGGGEEGGDNPPAQQTHNTETRPLTLAIGALDQNFNPFFSTSLTDSQIAGMTQASLLSSNERGEVVCGQNEPTVALDYNITMYDSKDVGSGNVIGGLKSDYTIEGDGSTEGRTEYEFLIKKGMKFSDGHDLTIKDVLFSLYVYLDPMYTGSATIYSSDIQGLTAWKTQDITQEDGADSGFESGFYATARTRISALVEWSKDGVIGEEPASEQAKTDLATVKRLFREEVETDWTAIESSWEESYEESYNFTEAWQAYLFNEGLVRTLTHPTTGKTIKVDAEGNYLQPGDAGYEAAKYMTTLEVNPYDGSSTPSASALIAEIDAASTAAKVSAYITQNGLTDSEEDKAYAKLMLQKDCAINLVYENYTTHRQIQNVVSYWMTATNALEEFAAEERTKYYASAGSAVPNISGISTYKTSTFKGKTITVANESEYDVLKIVINGIDPKAIWNFAFSVSPMHYYSNAEQINLYDGVSHFGVKMGDWDFFQTVLRDTTKNGIPVGAGAYKASSDNGSAPTQRSDFYKNGMVYFERNTYFETMGSGINNAKIKYLRYKVMSDDKIILALTKGEIDYGEPNATPDNKTEIESKSFLTSEFYDTAGYGYVGINPKEVPNVYIRRAIMRSMDTNSIISNYYGTTLAKPIHRPMSLTSWAYPAGIGPYVGEEDEFNSVDFAVDVAEIQTLCELAGYEYDVDEGKYKNSETGEKLTYTFTIAGESTDHPAYAMFNEAAEILNSIGWEVSVKPDIQALKKLASGSLAVWAAAWSSGIDPDMYQVYHKDSRATSVKNWGYDVILNDTTGDYDFELGIVNALSERIDDARETLDQDLRASIYHDCLDLVMEMAVELPTYQRADLCAYNNTVISASSVNSNPSHNMGVISKIWEVNYV